MDAETCERDVAKDKKKTQQQSMITKYTVPLPPSRIFSSQYYRSPNCKKNNENNVVKDKVVQRKTVISHSSGSSSDERPTERNLRSRKLPSKPRTRSLKQKPRKKQNDRDYIVISSGSSSCDSTDVVPVNLRSRKIRSKPLPRPLKQKSKQPSKNQCENDNDYILISSESSGSSDSDSTDDEPVAPMLLRSKRSARRRDVYFRTKLRESKKERNKNAMNISSSHQIHPISQSKKQQFHTFANNSRGNKEKPAKMHQKPVQGTNISLVPPFIDLSKAPPGTQVLLPAVVIKRADFPHSVLLKDLSLTSKLAMTSTSPFLSPSGHINSGNTMKTKTYQINIANTKYTCSTTNPPITIGKVLAVNSKSEQPGTSGKAQSATKNVTISKAAYPSTVPEVQPTTPTSGSSAMIAPASNAVQNLQTNHFVTSSSGNTLPVLNTKVSKTVHTVPGKMRTATPSNENIIVISLAANSPQTSPEGQLTTSFHGKGRSTSSADAVDSGQTNSPTEEAITMLSSGVVTLESANKRLAKPSENAMTPRSSNTTSSASQAAPDKAIVLSSSPPSVPISTSNPEKIRGKLINQTLKSTRSNKHAAKSTSSQNVKSGPAQNDESLKIHSDYLTLIQSLRHLMPEKYAPTGQRSLNSSLQSQSATTPMKKDKCGINYFDATQAQIKATRPGADVRYAEPVTGGAQSILQNVAAESSSTPPSGETRKSSSERSLKSGRSLAQNESQTPARNETLRSEGVGSRNKAKMPQYYQKISVKSQSASKILAMLGEMAGTSSMKCTRLEKSGRGTVSNSSSPSSTRKRNMAIELSPKGVSSANATTVSGNQPSRDDPIMSPSGSNSNDHRKSMTHRKIFSRNVEKLSPKKPSHADKTALRENSSKSNSVKGETPSDKASSKKRQFIKTVVSCLREDQSPSKRSLVSDSSLSSSGEKTKHDIGDVRRRLRKHVPRSGKDDQGATKQSSHSHLADQLVEKLLERNGRASGKRQQTKHRKRSRSSNRSGLSDSLRSQVEQRMRVLERLRRTTKRKSSKISKYSDNIENEVISGKKSVRKTQNSRETKSTHHDRRMTEEEKFAKIVNEIAARKKTRSRERTEASHPSIDSTSQSENTAINKSSVRSSDLKANSSPNGGLMTSGKATKLPNSRKTTSERPLLHHKQLVVPQPPATTATAESSTTLSPSHKESDPSDSLRSRAEQKSRVLGRLRSKVENDAKKTQARGAATSNNQSCHEERNSSQFSHPASRITEPSNGPSGKTIPAHDTPHTPSPQQKSFDPRIIVQGEAVMTSSSPMKKSSDVSNFIEPNQAVEHTRRESSSVRNKMSMGQNTATSDQRNNDNDINGAHEDISLEKDSRQASNVQSTFEKHLTKAGEPQQGNEVVLQGKSPTPDITGNNATGAEENISLFEMSPVLRGSSFCRLNVAVCRVKVSKTHDKEILGLEKSPILTTRVARTATAKNTAETHLDATPSRDSAEVASSKSHAKLADNGNCDINGKTTKLSLTSSPTSPSLRQGGCQVLTKDNLDTDITMTRTEALVMSQYKDTPIVKTFSPTKVEGGTPQNKNSSKNSGKTENFSSAVNAKSMKVPQSSDSSPNLPGIQNFNVSATSKEISTTEETGVLSTRNTVTVNADRLKIDSFQLISSVKVTQKIIALNKQIDKNLACDVTNVDPGSLSPSLNRDCLPSGSNSSLSITPVITSQSSSVMNQDSLQPNNTILSVISETETIRSPSLREELAIPGTIRVKKPTGTSVTRDTDLLNMDVNAIKNVTEKTSPVLGTSLLQISRLLNKNGIETACERAIFPVEKVDESQTCEDESARFSEGRGMEPSKSFCGDSQKKDKLLCTLGSAGNLPLLHRDENIKILTSIEPKEKSSVPPSDRTIESPASDDNNDVAVEEKSPSTAQLTNARKRASTGDCDVTQTGSGTKQSNLQGPFKPRPPSFSDDYETAPENIIYSAEDSVYLSVAEDLESHDERQMFGDYFNKQTFMKTILIPETNCEVIINESGPHIIDRSLNDETIKRCPSISFVTSRQNPASCVTSQSDSPDDDVVSNILQSESSDSDEDNDELLPSSAEIYKKLKYAEKAEQISAVIFGSLSPYPQLIKEYPPVKRRPPKRPLVVIKKNFLIEEPDERIVKKVAKLSPENRNAGSLGKVIEAVLDDTKMKMKERRAAIMSTPLHNPGKISDYVVESQVKEVPPRNKASNLSLVECDPGLVAPHTSKPAGGSNKPTTVTQTDKQTGSADVRTPILSKILDEVSGYFVDSSAFEALEEVQTDGFSPPEGAQTNKSIVEASKSECSVIVPPIVDLTKSPSPPNDASVNDSPESIIELNVPENVIPSPIENEEAPDNKTIDDDNLMTNYMELYSKICDNVVYIEDGDDDIIIPTRQKQISESSSDVIIVQDDSIEADIFVPPPETNEEHPESPTPMKLFNFDEFFDDPIESDDEQDNVLPQILVEEDLIEFRRKRARLDNEKSGDLDELPDLPETPSSKRRRLQLSQESHDSTSTMHQSTIEMLNHSIESSHNNSLDGINWLEGVNEHEDVDQDGDMKSRLRSNEPRHIELPSHVTAVLKDNTFNEAYKKHGASLRKLVKDKLREDKIAKMEESLIADLKRGNIHHILDDKEESEGAMDEYDEATKKALNLMKRDWGMLPRVETDSAIFQCGDIGFCEHTMSLDKYFADAEIQTLESHVQKRISKCKLSNRVSDCKFIVENLLDQPTTREQTLKWAVDGIICHRESRNFFKLIHSKMKSSNKPLTSFKNFKSLLRRAGIKREVLNLQESENGIRSFDKVCPKCQGITILHPERAMFVMKMIAHTNIFRESMSAYVEYVVLLLLAMHDIHFVREHSEIGEIIIKCLETADDWDEMKFVIAQQLLDVQTKLNVLKEIAVRLRAMRTRSEELACIIAFSTLTLHLHGTDISRDEDLDDPETYMSIVLEFNPTNIEILLGLDDDEVNTEKQAFYHMSLLLPLLGICIGKECKDARTSSILDQMSGILRMMMKKIRDNGFIYRSQVKYELTAFTKALRHVVQKAPKANKSSIFKYLRAPPVQEEVVNASIEETSTNESDDETTHDDVAE